MKKVILIVAIITISIFNICISFCNTTTTTISAYYASGSKDRGFETRSAVSSYYLTNYNYNFNQIVFETISNIVKKQEDENNFIFDIKIKAKYNSPIQQSYSYLCLPQKFNYCYIGKDNINNFSLNDSYTNFKENANHSEGGWVDFYYADYNLVSNIWVNDNRVYDYVLNHSHDSKTLSNREIVSRNIIYENFFLSKKVNNHPLNLFTYNSYVGPEIISYDSTMDFDHEDFGTENIYKNFITEISVKVKIPKNEIDTFRYFMPLNDYFVYTNGSNTYYSAMLDKAIDLKDKTCEHEYTYKNDSISKSHHTLICNKCYMEKEESHDFVYEYDGIKHNLCKCGHVNKINYRYIMYDDVSTASNIIVDSFSSGYKKIYPQNKTGYIFNRIDGYTVSIASMSDISAFTTKINVEKDPTFIDYPEPSGNRSMYFKAIYDPIHYKVKFHTENNLGLILDENLMPDQVFEYDERKELINNWNTDKYAVKGWCTDNTFSHIVYESNQELYNECFVDGEVIDLYPFFDEYEFKIIYHKNNTDIQIQNVRMLDSSYLLNLNDINIDKNTYKSFDGWKTEDNTNISSMEFLKTYLLVNCKNEINLYSIYSVRSYPKYPSGGDGGGVAPSGYVPEEEKKNESKIYGEETEEEKLAKYLAELQKYNNLMNNATRSYINKKIATQSIATVSYVQENKIVNNDQIDKIIAKMKKEKNIERKEITQSNYYTYETIPQTNFEKFKTFIKVNIDKIFN